MAYVNPNSSPSYLDGLIIGDTGFQGWQGFQGSQGSQGEAGGETLLPQLGAAQYPGLWELNSIIARGSVNGAIIVGLSTFTIVDIDGAGYMSRVFMTFNAHGTGADTLNVRMRVYTDGESTPSIDVSMMDMCCGRPGSFTLFSDWFACSQDYGSGMGTSFYFNLVAPFSSHLKVVFASATSTGQLNLGGWVEYAIGTGMNWGPMGKLWCRSLPGDSVIPYAEYSLLDISSATGGQFMGCYIYFQGGSGNDQYLEGPMQFYVDGPTITNPYDSTEDYFQSGFYFEAGTENTKEVGCTYKSAAIIGTYRFHDRDPIKFASSLKFTWINGVNGGQPTTNNTTVNGVVWYYTGAAGSVTTPTLIKGDQGVQGRSGTNGAPGIVQLAVVEPTTIRSPLILLTGNNTLTDSSGYGHNVVVYTGNQKYASFVPGGVKGFYLDGSTVYYVSSQVPALNLVGDMTIEFIARFLTLPGSACLLSYAGTGETLNDNYLYSVYVAVSGPVANLECFWEYGAGTNVNVNASTLICENETLHIAVRRSGTTVTFWINGVLMDTVVASHLPEVGGSPVQLLRIGSDDTGVPTSQFEFIIGGIQVIGSALTDAEILQDAESQLLWLTDSSQLGSQGSQGWQGCQGWQGTGAQGVQGWQGVQGANPGPPGVQGNQGWQGCQGWQGAQGNQGNQGAQGQGSQGNQGNQGDHGVQGNQGWQGFQGENPGAAGPQGFQGAGSGTPGAQGWQGFQGTGNQGNQGNQGFQGNQGWQGAFVGGALSQNLDASGYAFYDFDNGHSTSWTALSSDPSAAVLAVNILSSGYTLTASHKFCVSLGCRVTIYKDSDHTVAGYMDITVMVNMVTDGSSAVTSTFTITPVPDLSQLPSGLAGATCTVAASTGGFTISATRPTGVACHAFARWWVNRFEDVT